MRHLCHARNCEKECKPEKLMCPKHWALVPAHIQKEVYKHYRPGQCDDKKPNEKWILAANAAIKEVSRAEANVPREQTNMFGLLGIAEPEKKGRMH